MMQDMTTVQQHCTVSAATSPPPVQEATSNTDAETRHESSQASSDDSRTSSPEHNDLSTTRRHKITTAVDLKCQNNNEINENNENLISKYELPKKMNTNLNVSSNVSENNEDYSDGESVKDTSSLKSDRDDAKMETSQDVDSGADSEMKYMCPICEKILSSQHDFTLHIRSHNNDNETAEIAFSPKGYSCKICNKVLSSSSSLDRHVLVHSGERPFKCRVCAVAFTTNGNMHRHMRTHNSPKSNDYESDGSTDSTGSLNQNGKSPGSPTNNNNNKKRRVGTPGMEQEKTPELSPEANNNNKRKVAEILGTEVDPGKRRMKNLGNTVPEYCTPQRFQCPVCEREDFASLNVLETHLESSHPEYKIRCRSCDLDFKNHRVLNLHRFMVHHDKETSSNFNASVLGFKDLTFMDFSSEKFPHIARTVCEQKLHQASSAYHNFQCDKCGRAFPCGSALSIHHNDCYNSAERPDSDEGDSPTDLSRRTTPVKDRVSSDEEVEEKKREDFFAGLDLQNKSVPTSPVTPLKRQDQKFESASYFSSEPKDLADIQSIISVSNTGGLRLQDLTKSPVVNGSLTPSDRSFSDANEEEQQDCFASEFRKMKLKGEFPCRLCSAVFPNLRALKGHNRAHLVSGNLFRCNMCPYSNADKAILIRHMRSHNGDRPYECSLCNYAFTTKANCERHLRNRHSKLGRDEVKKSIIYHPSEDPTNDLELQAKISSGSDAKRSLNFNHSTEDLSQPERFEEKYQNKISPEKSKTGFERFDSFAVDRRSPVVVINDRPWDTHEVATMTSPNCDDSESGNESDNSNDDNNLVNLTINNNNNNLPFKLSEHQRINSSQYSPNNNTPLDLSMDVLDLSKKSTNSATKTIDCEPQDLSKKSSPPEYNNNAKKYISVVEKSQLQAQLMSRPPSPTPNQMPKVDLNMASFYAANPHAIYMNNNAFPFPPSPFMNPYFIPPQHPMGLLPPANLQEFAEMRDRSLKELIRGLQMSGGTMLDPIAMATAADKLQQLHQQAIAEFARNKEMQFNESKVEERTPVKEEKVVTNIAKLAINKVNPLKTRERDNSSVKMVIKNGVLMPKQKQRRYRTERPFFCEHCSARFTLRSNMERHIKQQHPEFWTQRQRGNVSGGRRNPNASLGQDSNSQNPTELKGDGLNKSQPMSLQIPNHVSMVNNYSGSFDMKPKSVEEIYETKEKHNIANNNNNKVFISDEVKYAIAQQLKSKLNNPIQKQFREETEEDDELIIDEEDNEDDKTKDEEVKNAKNSELARRDVDFEEGYKSFKDTFFRGMKSESKLDLYKGIQNVDLKGYLKEAKERGYLKEMEMRRKEMKSKEESVDLASVSRLLDNATTQTQAFQQYFQRAQDHEEEGHADEGSEDDEEGLVAASDHSGSDENRSDLENGATNKKKSAYSLAPNRVSCPYCHRKFPWSSSLRRHVLTHTGQKPYKCAHCPLLFTTKSNCDRHLLRKHANTTPPTATPDTSPLAPQAPQTSYTMRNVPERPYKCNHCPSSTFSTLSNLKKHVATKHPNSATKIDEVASNDESHDSEEENEEEPMVAEKPVAEPGRGLGDAASTTSSTSDLPFKCHLCEGSYGERQEALEHIRENHPTEFTLLMSKGALENNGGAHEDNNGNGPEEVTPGEESLEQLRGKFPDYANRKVMCAFCLRRFWSAEDLRRHMRTHTGERPFSCDICRRRFTLKHSMLRHRKKHSATDASPLSGDDEPTYKTSRYDDKGEKRSNGFPTAQPVKTEKNQFADNNARINGFLDSQNGKVKLTNHNNNNIMGTMKNLTSRYIMENPWPGANGDNKFPDERRDKEDETDLIGNLLGIQDKSIIDKMLVSKSADDAAKLLGVGNRE